MNTNFDPTSIVVPDFDPNNIDGNQVNNEQINPEVVHVQELPSSTFIGRIWSICSRISSLVLSPIHALGNLISRISHKIFSSQPSTPSTTPSNLGATISFGDNHSPEISDEQLRIIESLVSRSLDSNKRANPPAAEPQINNNLSDESPSPNDPNEVPSSPLTSTEVTAPNLPITDADLDQMFRDEEPFDVSQILPNELQVPADNPPPLAPSGQTLVQIPAQGSCLFMAIAVGLKKLYPNDAKINKILDWNYDPSFLGNDLRGDEDAANLRKPALHLRSLATVTILQELNHLNQWEAGLNVLENNNNEIEGPDEDKIEGSNTLENNGNEKKDFRIKVMKEGKLIEVTLKDNPATKRLLDVSKMIKQMKLAIDGYNEDLNIKIHESIEAYKSNIMRGSNCIESLLTGSNAGIAEMRIPSLGDAIKRNLEETAKLCKSKILCNLGGFNRKEITEMLRYVQVMQNESNYASYPEATALSELFGVPIKIDNQISGEEINIPDPKNPNPDKYPDPDKKPIHLVYDGKHFNLILE